MGEQTVCAQYHGSIENFESFEHSKLRSLGFHFGDIQQAKHFSGDNGYIYKVNLRFKNLFDIGEQDWGWTSAQHIALFFYLTCLTNNVPVSTEDFFPILGSQPWPGLTELTITKELSPENQERLISLFRSYDCDGIRYINKFEPPGQTGSVAYFVFDPYQIEITDCTET